MVPEKWVAKNLASHGSWQPIEILRGVPGVPVPGSWRTVACPHRPLELLRLWNQSPGETECMTYRA